MCRVLKQIGPYKILLLASGDYLVKNTLGEECNHGHLKTLAGCEILIDLMTKRRIPRSRFLRVAAMRITVDKCYRERIEAHLRREPKMYYNPNKGART